MEDFMKTILIIAVLLFLYPVCFMKAATAEDYIIVLENISKTCEHGRHLIFRDTNGDGIYDKVRKTNCDGTYTEDNMSVQGGGSFGRTGAHADVISGDVYSNAYKVRIYFPSDNTTLGYLEKFAGNDAIFTFSSH